MIHTTTWCTPLDSAGMSPPTMYVNLPGECWAEIQSLTLIGSSSSLQSEACNALRASDGVIHSSIPYEAACLRAAANNVWRCFSLWVTTWPSAVLPLRLCMHTTTCSYRWMKKQAVLTASPRGWEVDHQLAIPSRPFGYDQV